MPRDLYRDLEIEQNADADAIRRAFRRLTTAMHPDKHDKDPPEHRRACEERYKLVSAAYAVLGDAEKRRLYDRYGEASLRSGFNPRRQPPRRATRGADLHAYLEVSFLAALRGERVALLHRGQQQSVTLPPGAETGLRLRVGGEGEADPHGGPAGDLILSIVVLAHPHLQRDGLNLRCELPLTWYESLRGGPVLFVTPWGERWPIRYGPGEAVEGAEFELVGQGVRTDAGAGDLILRVRLVPPAAESRQLLAVLAELQSTPVRAVLERTFL